MLIVVKRIAFHISKQEISVKRNYVTYRTKTVNIFSLLSISFKRKRGNNAAKIIARFRRYSLSIKTSNPFY